MTGPVSIGRYTVVSQIGRGAMGVVYRAVDPVLERIVAIKTVDTVLDPREKELCEERFILEARAAGSLSHPNIVTIYEVGRSGEVAYIAMEFLEGRELKHLMSSRQLTFDRALDLAAQIADGLAFAHERGVVHRDIKPANIMVLPGDRVKITDFGIARMRSAETRTQTGVIQGSPRYLSPEQILGRPCEARSDVFSLGVMLYEMVTGRAPFDGDDVNAIMYKIVNAKAPPPSGANPTLPGMLDLIVAKTLAKDIDERYPSAAELAADLRACRLQRAGPVQVAPAYAAPDGIASITAELFADTMPEPIVEQGAGDAAIDGTTAYPLAKAFDSMQAVLRFEARNGRGGPANGASISSVPALGDAESGPAAGAAVAGYATRSFRTRAWSERDRRRFVSAVIGAVVLGTAIVLA